MTERPSNNGSRTPARSRLKAAGAITAALAVGVAAGGAGCGGGDSTSTFGKADLKSIHQSANPPGVGGSPSGAAAGFAPPGSPQRVQQLQRQGEQALNYLEKQSGK